MRRLEPRLHRRVLALTLLVVLLAAGAAPASGAIRLPLGIHLSEPDLASLELAADNGLDHVIVLLSWRDTEPVRGTYFWERWDALVRDAERLGLDLVLRLDQTPEWAADPAADPAAAQAPPADLDAYARFVASVAARYRDRVAGYILWNEPNLAREWGYLPPDPVAYTRLLASGAAAVRAADPGVPVLAAGLAPTNGEGSAAMDERTFLRAMYDAGAAEHFDILAAHPYGFDAAPETPHEGDTLNFRRLEAQRAIMVAAGDAATPIWITEFGWRVGAPPDEAWQRVSPARQAEYTRDAILRVESEWPWVERLALWWLGPPGEDFSVLGEEGPRPVLAAIRRAPVAPGDESRGRVPLVAPDVIVRLGDRPELRPHWFYVHGNGRVAPRWESRFALTAGEAATLERLTLSLMHIDYSQNELWLNGRYLASLPRRAMPDPSSHWLRWSIAIPPGSLREGGNLLELRVSLRHGSLQLPHWRWDNLQLRDVALDRSAPNVRTTRAGGLVAQSGPAAARGMVTFLAPAPTALLAGFEAPGTLALTADGERWRRILLPTRASPTAGLYHDGAWWVGSSDGLFRSADGERWERERGPEGWIYALEAHGGALWVAGERGLWATHGDGWRRESVRVALSLLSTEEGLYVGLADGVLLATNGGRWRRLPAPAGRDRLYARRLTRLPEGSLRVEAPEGMRWDGSWRALEGPLATASALARDARGSWWLSYGRGALLSSVGGRQWETRIAEGERTRAIHQLVPWRGELWGATHWGVLRLDPASATLEPVAAGADPPLVSALHQVGDTLWIGTPRGLYRRDSDQREWILVQPDLWINDIVADGPTLWLAARDGILVSDNGGATATPASGVPNLVYALEVDNRPGRRLLAGLWGYNLQSSADGRAFASVHNGLETLSVLSLHQRSDRPDEILVGTVEGLYETTDGGATWRRVLGPHGSVFALAGKGALIAASGEGLWRQATAGAPWRELLPGRPFIAAAQVDDWLLAATESGELWLGDRGGTRWRRRAAGLGAIYAIEPDGRGGAWLGGEQGLLRWSPPLVRGAAWPRDVAPR